MGNELSSPGILPDLDLSALDLGEEDESVIYTEPETFCYRVGVRSSAKGHCAASWGLDKPILTGNLRVTSCGDVIFIALWRKQANSPVSSVRGVVQSTSDGGGALLRHPLTLLPSQNGFALVAVSKFSIAPQSFSLEYYLEPVLDSSRYFVLRCQPPPGCLDPAVYLGIGFRHREAAFQLKSCLADHIRGFARQKIAEKNAPVGVVGPPLPPSDQGELEEEDWMPFQASPAALDPPVALGGKLLPPTHTSPLQKPLPSIRKPPPPPPLSPKVSKK